MEKEISSFLIIQEKSYFSAMFLERFWKDHLFRIFGKRKNGFSCSVIKIKVFNFNSAIKIITHAVFNNQFLLIIIAIHIYNTFINLSFMT